MRPIDPSSARARLHSWGLLGLAFLLTIAIYWPGLSGGWLFDDYPNIVDNRGIQPSDASISSLTRAALSSPSSEFKRPLASLSFAANYLAGGLDPYWMKLTNLLIHALNGLLVFLLIRRVLASIHNPLRASVTNADDTAISDLRSDCHDRLAALITAAWMVLPINLTGVLYVVQRMESMANVFVLLGLLGYIAGRQRMLAGRAGLALCALSVTMPTALGLLAKETAVMLPLYALLIEWIVFGFRRTPAAPAHDWRVLLLFSITLVLPMLVGLVWLIPHVLSPAAFSTRDFTLKERLLSEARIVVDYIGWTLLPTPNALSFYHDDFRASTGLLRPWTTLASLLTIGALICTIPWTRRRRPLVALGLGLYLGCHLLTGTILPLELIYEHRNYFASLGLLLAVVPLLASPQRQHLNRLSSAEVLHHLPMSLPRYVALGGLMLFWITETALTASAWGNPLSLAMDLASRAPESPRAQYELGRIYIIYSQYNPQSPFTRLAYAPLERAMKLPESSILPEQALIFMNSRMHEPLKDAWWDSMISKLKAKKPGVQDESSLGALTECAREHSCELPKQRMVDAFVGAIGHPNPSARLLAIYSDYAWNVLDDHALGERMITAAVDAAPNTAAYRITQARMLIVQGKTSAAQSAIEQIQQLNIGGSLDEELAELRQSFWRSTHGERSRMLAAPNT